VIIASVVPPLDPVLHEMVSSYFLRRPIFRHARKCRNPDSVTTILVKSARTAS
jgi:hypothetical protein